MKKKATKKTVSWQVVNKPVREKTSVGVGISMEEGHQERYLLTFKRPIEKGDRACDHSQIEDGMFVTNIVISEEAADALISCFRKMKFTKFRRQVVQNTLETIENFYPGVSKLEAFKDDIIQ